jgi:integration host factor subunit beta
MLKSDLILSINKNYPSLSHSDIELITDFFFKKIIESLKENKNLEIRGFGTFAKKINKEKYVRNPKTNEKIFKKQNYKIHFKIGKILHQRINPLQ